VTTPGLPGSTGLLAPLFLPSPSRGVWHLGSIPIRGYALCIILGIIVCVWVAERRWGRRGGRIGDIQDIALWAVPFGVVGGRLYHVITDNDLYFRPGRVWYHCFFIWDGGLGIWGAIILGAVGAMIGCHRKGMRFAPAYDTIGPCLLLAQGIGRWGNWFNQELFGRPTTLPWALKIDPAHWPSPYSAENPPPTVHGSGAGEYATFHPTYLYESIWDTAGFFVVVWLERRFRLGHGRVFACYVMIYCVGRFWIERLRIDTIELSDVLGMRWADWMSVLCFLGAAAYFVWSSRRHPGREEQVYVAGREPQPEPVAS
jgi:prolipoprotein diacylglyceryl transferase